jgi:Flp pilus assembly pilin Flp
MRRRKQMLRNFLKNRKAQNTAEYALLIALVVAGVIAMQTYAQRALQARIQGASQYMKDQTKAIGNATQYEPYYLASNYDVNTKSTDNKKLAPGFVESDTQSNRARAGGQQTSYNSSDVTAGNLI